MNHLGTQRIETNRLVLRRYVTTDAQDMFRNWVTDPEASKFWSWEPHAHIDETKALLRGWIDEYAKLDVYHWVIVLKQTSEAIGYIYLRDIDDVNASSSIHFLLSRKYWNRGIMTEACRAVLDFAFTQVGIAHIHTMHHINNPASGKVMQKSGMRYVKTEYRHIPECKQISGEYCYYEMLKMCGSH